LHGVTPPSGFTTYSTVQYSKDSTAQYITLHYSRRCGASTFMGFPRMTSSLLYHRYTNGLLLSGWYVTSGTPGRTPPPTPCSLPPRGPTRSPPLLGPAAPLCCCSSAPSNRSRGREAPQVGQREGATGAPVGGETECAGRGHGAALSGCSRASCSLVQVSRGPLQSNVGMAWVLNPELKIPGESGSA